MLLFELSFSNSPSELFCSNADEVLSHNRTSFRSRNWKVGFSHIDTCVRNSFLFCHYNHWGLELTV